jgi:hypothetical protein
MVDPEEMKRIREENLKLLKEELPGKVVVIKSNLYYDRKVREYKVMDVEDEYMMSGTRPIHGFRLVNDDFRKEDQPFLKYPTSRIIKEWEGDRWRLSLSYAHDVDIARDFRHLHKRTRPDLIIYIYYK